MKHFFIVNLLIGVMSLSISAQEGGSFRIYDKNGKPVQFSDMLKEASQSDLTFFGELHDNPISHWLELKMTKALYEYHGDDLILGAEMFETDQQLVLDEYINGLIPEKKFKQATHFWPNYDSDYKPLVDFAAQKGLKFVATNAPRRYANIVFRKGFKGLQDISESGKQLLPPLPIPYEPELKTYRKMREMEKAGPMSKANPNLPKAQALKDACMAYTISQAMYDDKYFLHFNGAYHSEYHEGIVWYLMHYEPHLEKTTITTVSQQDISKLLAQHKGKADFIIVVDADMTSTH